MFWPSIVNAQIPFAKFKSTIWILQPFPFLLNNFFWSKFHIKSYLVREKVYELMNYWCSIDQEFTKAQIFLLKPPSLWADLLSISNSIWKSHWRKFNGNATRKLRIIFFLSQRRRLFKARISSSSRLCIFLTTILYTALNLILSIIITLSKR